MSSHLFGQSCIPVSILSLRWLACGKGSDPRAYVRGCTWRKDVISKALSWYTDDECSQKFVRKVLCSVGLACVFFDFSYRVLALVSSICVSGLFHRLSTINSYAHLASSHGYVSVKCLWIWRNSTFAPASKCRQHEPVVFLHLFDKRSNMADVHVGFTSRYLYDMSRLFRSGTILTGLCRV